jgi:hypothetical protein
MRILLDESVPQKLRHAFENEHEVWTVRDKNWLGKKNGELLKLISDNKFELFVTVDRNLPYQQNLARLDVIIVVLCATNNRLDTLRLLVPEIFAAIRNNQGKKLIEVS